MIHLVTRRSHPGCPPRGGSRSAWGRLAILGRWAHNAQVAEVADVAPASVSQLGYEELARLRRRAAQALQLGSEL